VPTVAFKAKGKTITFKARAPKARALKASSKVSFTTKGGKTVNFTRKA
jgi:hypothetical protein